MKSEIPDRLPMEMAMKVFNLMLPASTAPDPAHRPPIECPACRGNGWGDAFEGEDDHAPCAACRGSGLAPEGAQ